MDLVQNFIAQTRSIQYRNEATREPVLSSIDLHSLCPALFRSSLVLECCPKGFFWDFDSTARKDSSQVSQYSFCSFAQKHLDKATTSHGNKDFMIGFAGVVLHDFSGQTADERLTSGTTSRQSRFKKWIVPATDLPPLLLQYASLASLSQLVPASTFSFPSLTLGLLDQLNTCKRAELLCKQLVEALCDSNSFPPSFLHSFYCSPFLEQLVVTLGERLFLPRLQTASSRLHSDNAEIRNHNATSAGLAEIFKSAMHPLPYLSDRGDSLVLKFVDSFTVHRASQDSVKAERLALERDTHVATTTGAMITCARPGLISHRGFSDSLDMHGLSQSRKAVELLRFQFPIGTCHYSIIDSMLRHANKELSKLDPEQFSLWQLVTRGKLDFSAMSHLIGVIRGVYYDSTDRKRKPSRFSGEDYELVVNGCITIELRYHALILQHPELKNLQLSTELEFASCSSLPPAEQCAVYA